MAFKAPVVSEKLPLKLNVQPIDAKDGFFIILAKYSNT
jgi:hypothetical protein